MILHLLLPLLLLYLQIPSNFDPSLPTQHPPLSMEPQASSTTSVSLPLSDSSTSAASSTLPAPLPPNQLNFDTSSYQETRCKGLDLLVEAILHVSGPSVFDMPSGQQRVARRAADEFGKDGDEEVGIEVVPKPKRRKRVMALPLKYQDSVLQPWRRSTRPKRSKSD